MGFLRDITLIFIFNSLIHDGLDYSLFNLLNIVSCRLQLEAAYNQLELCHNEMIG